MTIWIYDSHVTGAFYRPSSTPAIVNYLFMTGCGILLSLWWNVGQSHGREGLFLRKQRDKETWNLVCKKNGEGWPLLAVHTVHLVIMQISISVWQDVCCRQATVNYSEVTPCVILSSLDLTCDCDAQCFLLDLAKPTHSNESLSLRLSLNNLWKKGEL